MMVRLFALICLLLATPAWAQELRVSGSKELASVLEAWRAGFEKQNPGVRITNHLRGTASGQYGLEMRTTDIALMVRPLNPFELYGTYERSWIYPVQVEVATGGGYGIYVHPSNPLRQLSVEQLDGIFGGERDAGWDRLSWNKSAARGVAANIRNWGQVRGAGSARTIHVYGPPIEGQGAVSLFQQIVLQGGATWNEEYREFGNTKDMFAALARDPAGIAYAPLDAAPSGMKPLAIAARGGSFVAPTQNTLADRTYPLARPIYLYFTIDNAEGDPAPIKPLIRAFARYVLSPEGQSVVQPFPLPPSLVTQQRAIIESDAWPKERPRP